MTATPVSAPSVTSISFNSSSYTPGSTITATVTYVKGTSETPTTSTTTFTGTVTDSVTGQTGTLNQTFTVAVAGSTVSDATTPAATDSGGRTWVKASDTGTVATFTATA
jgi:hypothetical protein